MKKFGFLFILFLFSLASCNTTNGGSNLDVDKNKDDLIDNKDDDNNDDNDDKNNDDDNETKVYTLDEIISYTKNNFSSIEKRKTVDNLNNTTQLYKETLNVDQSKNIIFERYASLYSTSYEELDSYFSDELNLEQNCYYINDEGTIKCRYKNQANEYTWTERDIVSTNNKFNNLMLNKLDSSLFNKTSDNLYSVKEEYLSSEELSKFTTFYGSYTYFNQDFSYFNINVKENKITNIQFEIKMTDRSETSFTHDSNIYVSIDYIDVNNTSISIPELPVYSEDLLEPNEKLDKAIENTYLNYTYTENYKIIDESGNEKEYVSKEMINDDNSMLYYFNFTHNIYTETYDYFNTKVSFNGGTSNRLNEVVIAYYDDNTTYNTYDIGQVDLEEVSNRVERIGSSYGSKIFTQLTQNKFTPIEGNPERKNAKDKSYLYIATQSFLNHLIVGNYTSNSGDSYLYEINSFNIYINEDKLSKVEYDFNFTFTSSLGIVTKTHYIGSGEFSDIGTTKIIIPTDPNENITLDSNLTEFYNSINESNYTYKEEFEIFDTGGNHLNFYESSKKTIENGYYEEYVDNNKVKINLLGTYIDKDDNSKYDIGPISDYYYYAPFNVYNYYELTETGDNRSYSQNISGTYTFTNHLGILKDYLKYFKYLRTNTRGNKLFSLRKSYLESYGTSLIASVNSNYQLEFTDSIILTLYTDNTIKLSYSYLNYDTDGNNTGTVEGTISYSNINNTSVSVPNFDESLIDTSLKDTLNSLNENKNNLSKKEVLSINNFKEYNKAEVIIEDNIDTITYLDTKERKYPYFYNTISKYLTVLDNEGNNEIEVYKSLDVDFNNINLDYLSLKDGIYVVINDNLTLFYKEAFNLTGDNYKFNSAYISLTIDSLTFSLSYQYRFLDDNNIYQVFYMNLEIIYSLN